MDRRLLLVVVVLGTCIAGPTIAGASVPGPAAGGGTTAGAAQTDCSFPYETIDATGTTVRLDGEPERVVTLNPSAAQTMWEIGAGEKVVGLTKYAAYLDGAESRTNVSSAANIVVVETVVDLQPDLVLAPNATGTATVEQLRDSGVTVYHFEEARDVEDIYRKTRTVGRLSGECAGAEATVSWMRGRLGTVRQAVSGEPRPDVLYAFFGYTAGRGTFVHRLIETAGGNNVAADYGVSGYRQLSPEVVVEADPDWIVRNSRDPAVPAGAPFNATTAVREGQVVVVPIEHLNQPAPRVVHGVTTLARYFHPAAYAAANATETSERTTPTPTGASPTSTAAPPTTRTGGQTGLGLVSGLLGIAVAVLALWGRS